MKTILLISPYWKEPHRWMVSTVKLSELWQRLGYRVVVACMGNREGMEQVSPTLTIYRKKDLFLPDPWNYGIAFGFSGFVRKIVDEERPDTIVVNKILFWTSLALLGLRARGKQVVLLTDALVGMTWWPRGWFPQFCAAIYAWTLGWLLLARASRVIFFHPQPESLLTTLGIAKKSQVIPTGIDLKDFGPQTSDSGTHDQITVSYVGRLESVKGVDDFLAAATSVTSQVPITCQVVGFYEHGNALVQQYQSKASFLGLRDDIPEILAKTDIFVLPSYSEGLSNALMEAMASGCACIASDVGGNRFLIQNGVSGLLFPAGDREALAAHIRRLVDDPSKRKALGKAARERMEKEFSWDVVGEKYRTLFA